MTNFSYSVFTKKQANTIYAAIKHGELSAGKATIGAMYDMVNVNELTAEQGRMRGHFERCIEHLMEGRMEFAQMELDGHTVKLEYVITGTVERTANENDLFYELGETISEEVGEWRWVA